MFHKILVAIDKSEMSQQVFDKAVSLAKATDARLMLLHVSSPFDEYYLKPGFASVECAYPNLYSGSVSRYMNEWEEYEREGLDWLRSLAQEAIAQGVKTEFTQNLGDPGQMICALARTWHSDVIIMGRRGRTGLSELFLGSVSNYVLHHAPCAVLVVQHGVNVNNIEAQPKALDYLNT